MVIVKKQVCNQSAFFTIVCKKEVTSKFDLIFTKLSSLYMYICYHTQNSMFTKGGSRNGGGGSSPTCQPCCQLIDLYYKYSQIGHFNYVTIENRYEKKKFSLQLANFKFC